MNKLVACVAMAAAVAAAGCGATTRSSTGTIQTPTYPTLVSATVTFVSRDHGKDEDSGLTLQVMRNSAELVGEVQANNIKFDDDSSSGPFVVSLIGPFNTNEIDTGQVRNGAGNLQNANVGPR